MIVMDLYIIAGCKGCGKSRFIDYCLRNKYNPFFSENDFLSFNPHSFSLDYEWKIDPSILLTNQHIISLAVLSGLDRKENLPRKLLVHFDLFNIQINEQNYKLLNNPEDFTNLSYVKNYFNIIPSNIDQILTSYENIFVITIKIDSEYNKKLFLSKSKKINRKLTYAENFAFKSKQGRNIIDNFHQAWIDLLFKFKSKVKEHILVSFDEFHNFYTINNFEMTKSKRI
jgi:hypothetical protein